MRSATLDVMAQNYCFYIGFVSKLELAACFVFAPWRGLMARLVLSIFAFALKAQRGSKYRAARLVFAL